MTHDWASKPITDDPTERRIHLTRTHASLDYFHFLEPCTQRFRPGSESRLLYLPERSQCPLAARQTSFQDVREHIAKLIDLNVCNGVAGEGTQNLQVDTHRLTPGLFWIDATCLYERSARLSRI